MFGCLETVEHFTDSAIVIRWRSGVGLRIVLGLSPTWAVWTYYGRNVRVFRSAAA